MNGVDIVYPMKLPEPSLVAKLMGLFCFIQKHQEQWGLGSRNVFQASLHFLNSNFVNCNGKTFHKRLNDCIWMCFLSSGISFSTWIHIGYEHNQLHLLTYGTHIHNWIQHDILTCSHSQANPFNIIYARQSQICMRHSFFPANIYIIPYYEKNILFQMQLSSIWQLNF